MERPSKKRHTEESREEVDSCIRRVLMGGQRKMVKALSWDRFPWIQLIRTRFQASR